MKVEEMSNRKSSICIVESNERSRWFVGVKLLIPIISSKICRIQHLFAFTGENHYKNTCDDRAMNLVEINGILFQQLFAS